jgi:dipeptidyl aminopeptidase/acylaminoacyl peptidase
VLKGLHALMMCAAALLAAQVSVQAAPPPPDAFTRPSAITKMELSPSGQRVAMVVVADTGRGALAVLDLSAKGPARTISAYADADVVSVRWVNDERLVYEAFAPGILIREGGAGTFAIDHDGKGQRQLIAWLDSIGNIGTRITNKLLPYGWFLRGTLDDGSADVIVEERITSAAGEPIGTRIGRLNTLSGSLKILSLGAPLGATNWVFDRQGEVRVAQVARNGRDRLYLREGSSSEWTLVSDVDELSMNVMEPLFIEGEHSLIVATHAGRDTTGLYSYDLHKRKLDPEPLMAQDRYDAGSIETDRRTHSVVGVHLNTDRPTSVWFTAHLADVQRAVDSALPSGRFNTLLCGRCESSLFYLVYSRSDRQPGEYHVYDPKARTLARLGERRPWIDEATQGRRSMHWINARDGQPLPVVVTHPPGRSEKEALPALLIVHGGPWTQGADRRWDAEAQFFASRGYRVIEPSFRGTLGLGWKHFQASWKQWGLAMQDDLADALAWAVAQGMVDPQRACIYGGSYGGYAALMGPISHPDAYRCAISFAGVTDIDLMYSSTVGDITDQAKRYSMPVLIGDRKADAELLLRASPIRRVAEIKVPVLLVQGTLDRRVPREHANAFEATARKAGVVIDRVDYNDAGHGWGEPGNHADFLARIERFLAQSLRR